MRGSNFHVGLILFNMPLDQTSGSCRHVGDLASSLIKKGIKVTIFSGKARDRKHVNNLKKIGVNIREINFPNLGSWGNLVDRKNSLFISKVLSVYIKKIISEHLKNPIDVLNIQHLIVSPVIGLTIKHLLDIPFVLTCQGSDIYELSDKKYRKKFSLVSCCDALICISPKVKKEVMSINNNIKNMFVIPLGVDRDIFRNLNIKRKKQVLFAGRLIREKGIEEAIKVFLSATDLEELSNYKLIIAGSGYLRKQLEEKYHSFIKKKRIVFLGDVPQRKLVSLMNKSRLFLFTSTWEEPFGMVLTEALSTKTPIIANDVGFAKKIVLQGGGIIIEKNNWDKFSMVTKKLLSNEKELKKISRGEMAAKKYDWNKTVKKIIDVYKSIKN